MIKMTSKAEEGLDMEKVDIEQGHTLEVLEISGLSFSIKPRRSGRRAEKTPKTILENVSASFQSGELTMLIGPSGAGKTTLLKLLAGSTRNDAIRLNGEVISQRGEVCLCPQDDLLHPALTVRQTIRYCARLSSPAITPMEEIETRVEQVMHDLQLTEWADVVIGDSSCPSLSGGQRKRVSVAMDLVRGSKILALDEPTSGLDSSLAEDLVDLLASLAHDKRMMIICTIHQPSARMAARFDKMVMLSRGKVVYAGPTGNECISYFHDAGVKVEPHESPLETFMRAVQFEEGGERLRELWENRVSTKRGNKQLGPEFPDMALKADEVVEMEEAQLQVKPKLSAWHQFKVLFTRSCHNQIVDKNLLLRSVVAKLISSLLIGVVYVNQARSTSGSSITATLSALFFLVLQQEFNTQLKAVLNQPVERAIIKRELRSGLFHFTPYFFAQFGSIFIVEAFICLLNVPAYFLVGLGATAGQFFIFIAAMMLITFIGVAIGMVIGSTARDVSRAIAVAFPLLVPLILFAGFAIPVQSIPSGWIWAYYLSFFQWTLSILQINEFSPRVFTSGSFSTGTQFLESQNLSQSQLGRDFGILLAFLAFFLLLSYWTMRRSYQKIM